MNFNPELVQKWVDAITFYKNLVNSNAPITDQINAKNVADDLFHELLSSVGVSDFEIRKAMGTTDNEDPDN
jgi:hypothetical protein